MLRRNEGGIRTKDPSEDVQVFNYTPRAGGDGQFRILNYRYPSRGVPPPTAQDSGEFRRFFDKVPTFSIALPNGFPSPIYDCLRVEG